MKINELQVAKKKSGKRVGRGIAAGQGKTAGRGTKGQMARTGSSKRPGFEGGQNPLMQRLPKLPGFRSSKPRAEVIYTRQLDAFSGKTVDAETLAKAGLISGAYVKVKVITKGEVTKKVAIKAQAISASALEAVQKAGGSFEKVDVLARPANAKKAEKKEANAASKAAAKAKKAA
ncbi:MAG TPA: 50S ribosomal protein L15 [Candidatus Saccharimonadales bacterium]|nr:50S ribosomal protein L15 [Candidatus Saccharimonadales bacterium]